MSSSAGTAFAEYPTLQHMNKTHSSTQRSPGLSKVNSRSFISVPINMPVTDEDDYVEWRQTAQYSRDFEDRCNENRQEYLLRSRAQSQEDVWLFENLFYGMKGGVILESGALNGVLFSTSMLFERFANWTAIHIGEASDFSLLSAHLSFYSYNRNSIDSWPKRSLISFSLFCLIQTVTYLEFSLGVYASRR